MPRSHSEASSSFGRDIPQTGSVGNIDASKRKTRRIAAAGWTPSQLAKLLGVSKRTVNRRCNADLLPFIDHGTPQRPRRYISPDVVRLVRIYGLAGVARMRQANLI
jgi:hypothetical protein